MEEILKDITVAQIGFYAAVFGAIASLFGGIIVAIINHISNSSLRKKVNAHEEALETIRSEYAKRMKELEYDNELKLREKDAEYTNQLEILRNNFLINQKKQEAISNYLKEAGKFFANKETYYSSNRQLFIVAHNETLPLVSENAASIMKSIFNNGNESSYNQPAAIKNIEALAEEFQKDGVFGVVGVAADGK